MERSLDTHGYQKNKNETWWDYEFVILFCRMNS